MPSKSTSLDPDLRVLPESGDQWIELLRLIPGYDPFRLSSGHYFDADEAARRINFWHDCITHTKGSLAGKPMLLERWQQAVVANLYGWKREADDLRRYRTMFGYVPRKNGKTTMVAGMAIGGLLLDREAGAEVYSAAAEQKQARLLYDQVSAMVAAQPALSSRLRDYPSTSTVVHTASRSKYTAISSEANTKHGFNTHIAIVDELHAQPNAELYEVLETSMGSRSQPIMATITTADYDRPSICNTMLDYAEKVRDGIIDDATFLPVIYAASIEDDWQDPEVWYKANPNLGISLSMDYMQAKARKAVDQPSFENTFKRLHLNMRTQQDVRWLQLHRWDAGDVAVDETGLRGKPCYAGLDLSATTDISAFLLVFPRDDGGIDIIARFWVPEDRAREREQRDRVPYTQWIREGYIRATPGEVIDYDRIRQDINEDAKRYNIQDIALDRWNATQLGTQLDGDGLSVVLYGQGYASLSAPSKHLEGLVVGGKIRHGGNPVLRWMASNVAIESDAAGNIKPSKKKSTERIDGIVALVMAIGRWQVAKAPGPSVYESRGVLQL